MLAAPGCEVRVFPQKEGVGFSPAFCGHVLEGGEFVTWDGSRAASSVKWILQKTRFDSRLSRPDSKIEALAKKF